MEIFGFNFKSKAEKEKEARDYMERVFPGGEKEREQVRQELTKRLPEKDETDLLLCYVHIRDRMTGTGLSFEQVAGEVEKLQWIPDMDQKSLREFDTSKLKRILQSLETGLFFCQIFVFII